LFAKWTSDAAPVVDTPVVNTPAAIATGSNASLGVAISFSAKASVLTKAHKTALKKSVKASGKNATYVVTGSAGMLPGATKTQVRKLANLRANVIKSYLVKLGVNKANLSIKIKITNQGIVPKTKTLAKYLVS
jgi:outer membrane protein OmpA-like peptidoglycan-associated protein